MAVVADPSRPELATTDMALDKLWNRTLTFLVGVVVLLGLTILPLARSGSPPAKDFLATPAMDEVIAELRRRFELVILDTGPVILVTATRQLVRHADSVVVLARWRKTSRRTIQTTLKMLDAAGAKVAGVALGQVDLRSGGHADHADPSSYYRSYHQYYAE